jgi:sulfur carrier protein ThiS
MTDTANTASPAPAPRFAGIRVVLPEATQVAVHPDGDLFVGSYHDPELTITAPTLAALADFLERALAAVHRRAPDMAPGPDPDVVEARQVLVEDVLRSLGVPKNGVAVEIEEIAVSDIRVARRLTQRAVDLLEPAATR